MKIHFLLSLFIFSFFNFSCSNNSAKEEHEVNQNQTPEVLDDSKKDISSISKRYASDMVQDLFNEAVSKDNNLKILTNNLNEIGDIKSDSLKAYREYNQNNNLYWSSANRYVSMISDSVLKNDLKAILKEFESNYQNIISKHDFLVEKIEGKENILNDYAIIMKLSVTIPMISSYQKNELPDIKTLNNIVDKYDTLINETKNYSTIIK